MAASNHTIVIDANFEKVTKQFDALAKTFDKKFQKRTGIKIFDETATKKFLEDSQKSIDKLKNKISDVTKEMEKEKKIVADTTKNTKDRQKAEERINELHHQRNDMIKKAMEMDRTSQSVKRKSMGFMGRMTGGVIGGGGANDGGGMMGALGAIGASPVGMAAMALGGAAVSRGMAAYNTYAQGLDSRITLRGRGARDVSGANSLVQQMGLTPEQARQIQIQSMDAFGRKGSSLQQVGERAKFERGFGLDPGTMTGVGSQLRQSLGNQGALKAIAKLQGSIMAEEIDGAIGPYLETAANMLTQINDSGMALDDNALNALAMLSQDKGLGPERAGRMIGTIDQAIRGATGERSAFFQAAAARAGLGGGMIGGAESVMQSGGLFGLDAEKAKKMGLSQGQMGALGKIGLFGGGFTQKFAKGISSTVDAMGFGTGPEGELAKGQFVSSMMGLSGGPAEGMAFMNAIKTLEKNPQDREALKKLDELGKTPEQRNADRMESVAKSTELTHKAVLASMDVQKELLGQQLVPVAENIFKVLLNIDKGMAKLAGGTTFEEERQGLIRSGNVSKITSEMSPAERAQFNQQMQSKIKEEQENLQKMKTAPGVGDDYLYKDAMLRGQQQKIDQYKHAEFMSRPKDFLASEAAKGQEIVDAITNLNENLTGKGVLIKDKKVPSGVLVPNKPLPTR